jgi:DNA-binding IclR family transcriptional regulator
MPEIAQSAGTRTTSIDKALEVCEALSRAPRGLSVAELHRLLRQPPSSIHRLLALLKRRGYVQQDEDSARYRLTLKMLDLSFRLLGRSELRLHAYPVLREYVLRTGLRAFLAASGDGEVTYLWTTEPDAVAMHTTYGKAMPSHCAMYYAEGSTRRLSCLRLERGPADVRIRRLEPPASGVPGAVVGRTGQHLGCTCAPVVDYTGREVARVGVFGHDVADDVLGRDRRRDALELARLVSLRLGATLSLGLAGTA